MLELPATVFVVGAILAPWMAAIGAIATIATRCQVIVERIYLIRLEPRLEADRRLG